MIKIKMTASECQLKKMSESMKKHFIVMNASEIYKNHNSRKYRQYLEIELPDEEKGN